MVTVPPRLPVCFRPDPSPIIENMPRPITEEEKQYADTLVARAQAAMKCIEDYDQAQVDRLCQAVGWATANETTFTRLANMSVDESGLGDRAGRPNKRFKIMGILRFGDDPSGAPVR